MKKPVFVEALACKKELYQAELFPYYIIEKMEQSASQHSYSRRASSSALSHFSARHSILSLESSQKTVFRPSTVKDCFKDVVVWTPVVLEKDFPAIVKKEKIHYQTNTHINAQSFP